jgi:dipeptidyl aminopeptidase/acylaminoacyl peptidase
MIDSRRIPLSILAASAAVLAFCASLAAQGTQSDYQRANSLRAQTEGKVFKSRVTPHWLAGNSRFWYRNDLAQGEREFVMVDAMRGTRQPAFDHARLAAAMAKATGKTIDAKRLPIDQLDFDDKESVVLVGSEGKAWRCDLRTYDLRPEKSGAKRVPASSLPNRTGLTASTRTGSETSITFVNRTKADVDIFWLDADGERKPYGTVRAGQEHQQHTFAGHVWLASDRQGKVLAVFEATEEPGTALVDGGPRGDKLAQEKPRRRRELAGTPREADSPDGRWLAFFKDHNFHLRDVKTGQEHPLSGDGDADDEYSGHIWWSWDSKKVAVLRTKKGDDRKVHYVESSPKDQLQPKLHSYDYLKPGDRIPLARPQLFDVAGRKRTALSDELFPNPWSITELRWEPDSRRFTFLYNQRGHQVLRLVAVDAATGKAHAIVDEQSRTFIDYSGKKFIHYLDETREIIWMSERDGWNHLYLYDAATGHVKGQITQGDWVVRGVDRVDDQKRQICFRAGGIRPGQDPYYVHFCRVNFDGSGLVILTEGDGDHSIELAPDQRFFVDTWSRVDLPPQTELRRTEDGKLVCCLEKADWSQLLKTGWRVPERFVAKGRDGVTDIYGVIFRPTHFDPKKKYPIIEEVYAGPQGSFVPKSFRAFHSPQAMAELGFILVKIDGMGTSNRSKKFHDVCWKNLGDSGFPDRILWIKAAEARYPYMDTPRIGIYGGSAGGQSATRALLAHGDFYKVAASDCGCHDNRMDKIWWNEQWMGWPIGPQYVEQSNVTQAHRLHGKLLLVVGEMDENVDPASTMQLVNALIRADKDFDLIVMTGRGHGSAESPYGNRRRQDFFVRHLLGVEPRGQP